MGNVEEKLKALREAAKLQSQASIVEEVVDIPEDIDKNRLTEIAKELHKTTLLEPTPDLTSLTTVIDEIPEEEEDDDIPEYEPDPEEPYSPFPDTPEESNLLPDEFPDEEIKETITQLTPNLVPETPQLKALVLSVTTIPFTPAKHPTNGERPIPMTKYQVLFEVSQPLQLGREYQIIL